jgi:hypothetical protein
MKIYTTIKSKCVAKYTATLFLMSLFMSFSETYSKAISIVIDGQGNTYIVDRAGERWDVTQAGSIGFRTDRFQYGIGRNIISPLNNSHLSVGTYGVPEDLLVIGVEAGTLAHAYSVPKLTRLEIANIELGEKKIAAGY